MEEYRVKKPAFRTKDRPIKNATSKEEKGGRNRIRCLILKPPAGLEKRDGRVKSRKNSSEVDDRNCRNGAEIETATSVDGEKGETEKPQDG